MPLQKTGELQISCEQYCPSDKSVKIRGKASEMFEYDRKT